MLLRYLSIPFLVAEAAGDPWSTNTSLQAGRPAEIAALAKAFHDAGVSTVEADRAFEAARRRFEESWNHQNGENPINTSAEVLRVIRSLALQAEQLPKAAIALENIAVALAEAQRTSAWYLAALEYDLEDIDDEICDARADEDQCATDDLRGDAVAETRAMALLLRQIRDRYSSTLVAALRTLRTDGVDPAEIQCVDELSMPPTGTSPEQVMRWWDSLSTSQRQLLIDQRPRELGNLNGIPAEVRDPVNQASMNDDLRKVEDAGRHRGVDPNALRDSALNNRDASIFTDPGDYGLSAADITRYQNAVKTNDFLQRDEGSAEATRELPIMLWAYDPLAFDGKGRAAIAIGNPDKSRNTAVIVPGTNSSVRGGWMSDGPDDAINLYEQSLKADPGHSTAVMAWMGYDAPEFDAHWQRAVTDPANLEQVGTPWRARQAGALLAADVNGLAATRDAATPTHVTVLGHSYGSTTVADAFANSGMRANDAVLTGCPGTDLARSAADFHLDGGSLYVGAASTDAISWIGESGGGLPNGLNATLDEPVGPLAGLGTDPAHAGFGAVRFRAEVAGSHSVMPWFTDHSHYYDVGSESLHNITEVVTGHGDRLAGEGMVAADRAAARVAIPLQVHTQLGTISLSHVGMQLPVAVDPEWDRPARSITNGHGF